MKKIMKKCIIPIIFVICNLFISTPAFAEPVSESLLITPLKPVFDLEWCYNEDFSYLVGVFGRKLNVTYTYDSNWQRDKKEVNGVSTYFKYQDSMLLSENRDGKTINYIYPSDAQYWYDIIGFEFDGNTYYYSKDDESNSITGIKLNGEMILQYLYSNGLVTCVLGKVNSEWLDVTSDSESIGNINLIRYNSFYFDIETNWYYYSGSYFDTLDNCFINDINGASRVIPPQSSLDACYQAMLKSYGSPISYTSDWYSSLNTLEIFARLIYGESNNDINNVRGIAWVVFNRMAYNTSEYGGSTLSGVILHPGAWKAITSTSSNTNAARNPDKTSQRWKDSVYIAAVCNYTLVQSELVQLIPKPTGISTQKYVNTYAYFYLDTVSKDGSGCIQYNWGSWTNLTKCNATGSSTNFTKKSSIPNTTVLVFFDYQ